MQVTYSKFLKEHEAKAQELLVYLSDYYDHISILGKDVRGKHFGAGKKTSRVEDYEFAGRGFVFRVFKNAGYLEYSIDAIEDLCGEELRKELVALEEFVEGKQLPTKPMDDFVGEENTFKEVGKTIDDIDVAKLMHFLKEQSLAACALDEAVIDADFSLEVVEVSEFYMTLHGMKRQSYGFADSGCSVKAVKGDEFESDYEFISGLKGAEIIDDWGNLGERVVKKTLELFEAEHVVPGTYDIICDPDIAGLIAHEAFGHGVEMDMFVKNRALAKEYIGQKIASDIVNMRDGAAGVEQVSSYAFDDEGVAASNTLIIENGILKQGISDLESAMRLGTKPTGNGKRESFERKAYARMTNTYFCGGTDTYEDMVASISYGYLLEGMMSGMEDPKHWGIQCIATRGREIKDGKFTGKIVSPVILTGFVPDLLKSISMISKEVVFDGSGYCGKGYKEWVKTSTGGPYLKAKARLG